ncbi:phosphotransferase [Legionella oakridgensis]|uniref:Phosphotransferase enzyme family n=2 Tax=Legionella oakridgensis TaxID=29423 RepID=W0BCK6_9GAMM|nr:phosphotransferase [Legionella oakridgensis]AHE66154.1 phosphotransferase enzyme family [Legionella oakridgensis ATCC 33761 = DSM 21215]ETO94019.1 phosphotransferase enzyme family [Legionella oakridgensis RV-2-2007]KTD43897.1 putative aminoglycoside phosphotransferase [Legionella oakridgensis]STY16065.1 aminoglycoside phosphotransferase [Legionella longbeachae]
MNDVLTSFNADELSKLCKTLFHQTSIAIIPLNHTGIHNIWLVKLQDKSVWISKQIKSGSWLGALSSDAIEFNEIIASMVADKLGITLPAHQWMNNQYLVPNCRERLLFIPYCKGRSLSSWTGRQSFLLGVLLAAMHQLPLPTTQAKPFPEIKMITANTTDFLNDKIQQCNENRLHALSDWVTSHRDIYPANVIWQNKDTPFLIDWESTGLIHPFVELIGVAVNAAGLITGQFNRKRFEAVLMGYKQQAGKLPRADDLLWALCYHSWLLWLSFNWQQGQETEVQKTLFALQQLSEYMPSMQKIYIKLCKHTA